MSRRMVAPGVWDDEGAARPYVISGYGGTLVQGASGSSAGAIGQHPGPRRVAIIDDEYLRDKRRKETMKGARCLEPMRKGESCGRVLGHESFHTSFGALEERLARYNARRRRARAAARAA